MKRNFIYIVLITSVLLYSIMIFINYKIDVFGLQSKKDAYLNSISYERYQNIGIAKNFPHQTIITGTSLSENFKVSLANKLFNTVTIKIPMSGASAKEQNILMLNTLGATSKKVIWDIHYTAYYGEANRMHKNQKFPLYLYDDNALNDLKFYSSFDNIKLSAKYLLFKDRYFTSNFDELYNLYDIEKNKFGKENVLKYIDNLKVVIQNLEYNNKYKFNNLKNSFIQNILPIIKNNPKVEFNFFFTPYTPYYYLGFYKSKRLDDIISFKEYIIKECLNLENVRLHDFGIDYKTIENLNNYKDTHHFSQNISDKILNDIYTNKFLIKNNWKQKNIVEYKKYIINKLEIINDKI